MGSLEAMAERGEKRYLTEDEPLKVAQGVSGAVVDKGSVVDYVPYLMQAVKHAMQDMGCRTIPEMHKRLHEGELGFERRSTASRTEGGVHSLHSFTDPHRFHVPQG